MNFETYKKHNTKKYSQVLGYTVLLGLDPSKIKYIEEGFYRFELPFRPCLDGMIVVEGSVLPGWVEDFSPIMLPTGGNNNSITGGFTDCIKVGTFLYEKEEEEYFSYSRKCCENMNPNNSWIENWKFSNKKGKWEKTIK